MVPISSFLRPRSVGIETIDVIRDGFWSLPNGQWYHRMMFYLIIFAGHTERGLDLFHHGSCHSLPVIHGLWLLSGHLLLHLLVDLSVVVVLYIVFGDEATDEKILAIRG